MGQMGVPPGSEFATGVPARAQSVILGDVPGLGGGLQRSELASDKSKEPVNFLKLIFYMLNFILGKREDEGAGKLLIDFFWYSHF